MRPMDHLSPQSQLLHATIPCHLRTFKLNCSLTSFFWRITTTPFLPVTLLLLCSLTKSTPLLLSTGSHMDPSPIYKGGMPVPHTSSPGSMLHQEPLLQEHPNPALLLQGLPARFVANKATKLWTATTTWTMPFRAVIHHLSWLPWLLEITPLLKTTGMLTMGQMPTSLLIWTNSLFNSPSMAKTR